MDYKEKVIALLNSQELSNEQKEKLEHIFPELRESEDEKIRKWLIRLINTAGYRELESDKMPCSRTNVIAWLEKQGSITKLSEEEQNRFAKGVLTSCALSFIDFLDAHKYEGKMCVSNGECEDIENAFHNAMWDRLHRYYCKYIEKQGEQKSTDKVNPKFHEGDWIVFNGLTLLVDEVIQGYYRTISIGGIHNSYDWNIDNVARLWTIQDAKDGDVLMANAPFIFNGNLEGGIGCPGAHCGINTLGKFQIPNYPKHWTGHTTTPATKEQRDALMKAMADTGYTFDFEKKELKKIEQKPQRMVSAEAKEAMYDKPVWSEEDETGLTNTIIMLKEGASNHFNKKDITKAVDWLKSLKDRCVPQQNQEWSEEDEKRIKKVMHILSLDGRISNKELKSILNWLKSLRPQNRWKPSDEQMEVLLSEVKGWTKGCPKQIVLESLYNDLKKLKE